MRVKCLLIKYILNELDEQVACELKLREVEKQTNHVDEMGKCHVNPNKAKETSLRRCIREIEIPSRFKYIQCV